MKQLAGYLTVSHNVPDRTPATEDDIFRVGTLGRVRSTGGPA